MTGDMPFRGDVWLFEPEEGRGHEQTGTRPGLILSIDRFNRSGAELVAIIPLTSRHKIGIPWHVEVLPPEAGVIMQSFIKCEDLRSSSTERLIRRLGSVSPKTLHEVEERVRTLLGL
jgi:mRNA interferase MazF